MKYYNFLMTSLKPILDTRRLNFGFMMTIFIASKCLVVTDAWKFNFSLMPLLCVQSVDYKLSSSFLNDFYFHAISTIC